LATPESTIDRAFGATGNVTLWQKPEHSALIWTKLLQRRTDGNELLLRSAMVRQTDYTP